MSSESHYSPDFHLTAIQHKVLNLLVEGASMTQAAAAAGVHRNTVANWRRIVPAFAREFELASRERALFWHEQSAGLAEKAVEVLRTVLNDETAAPSLRLRAALKVIGMATETRPQLRHPYPAFTAEVEAVHGQMLINNAPYPVQPEATVEEDSEDLPEDAPHKPVILAELAKKLHNSAQSIASQPLRRSPEPGRNSPCPCGSGVKYKRCCAQLRTQAA